MYQKQLKLCIEYFDLEVIIITCNYLKTKQYIDSYIQPSGFEKLIFPFVFCCISKDFVISFQLPVFNFLFSTWYHG